MSVCRNMHISSNTKTNRNNFDNSCNAENSPWINGGIWTPLEKYIHGLRGDTELFKKGKEQNRHALNEDWKLQMKHDQHQYFSFCYTTLPICKFKYWWTWNHLSHWLGNDLRSCWVNVLSLHFCHFLKNQLMWP